MARFIISCGGTGGHLSPGISLAEGLHARGHEAVLLISQKKVDTRLSEKYPHLRFERMPGAGFALNPVKLAKCVLSQTAALRFCLRLMRREKPAAVIGFGGFTSAPVVLAGRLLGVPVALHESNRVPGLAIRTLGRFAKRVYLPPGITIPGIRSRVTRHVGLPVRSEIVRHSQAAARKALGLAPERRVLAILGGSQGASPLNDWVSANLERLAAEDIQLYVVTGMGKSREGVFTHPGKYGVPVKSIFVPFSDRMSEVMCAADLVVSRAGAGTLAELIRCETPAILVPYPQAADDHQRANAEYFEQQGGGLVVAQPQLAQLQSTALDAIFNEWLLRKFRDNLRRMDRANSLELMLGDLENLVKRYPPADRGVSLVVA